ncbi:hypothetical protein AMS68_005214 [Peltaster fructicola]|uniref:Zinc finger ZPR1-type domain-containing protein n=1 Tax=Peltaster fructicola TaxID=286661 RepID=A0A6H0XY43_9PEZI|nr:hypothetical protein AMS68_005214 [Peltaster fructicola]
MSLAQDLFRDMGAQAQLLSNEQNDTETTQKLTEEIESLCMNCHENGSTRLLLTRIPFFKEIIIMSFSCSHCGFSNNEIQSAGEIQPNAVRYAYKLEKDADLQRQVVKTDTCVFRVEDLDLEIPPGKGRYTNIEGVLSSIRDDLVQHQDERLKQMPEVGEKVSSVIRNLEEMLAGSNYPFMISVDDPAGNSWIEPKPGDPAGSYAKSEYPRTPEQNALLGLGDEAPEAQAPETEIRPEYHSQGMVPALPTNGVETNNVDNEEIVEDQVYSFPASCPGCTRPCSTNMKMVNIPYFKQVVLMSTVCEHCGYRSNEVKTGGEVPEKGRRLTLRVENEFDLARDVLKSESAALHCPELQLRVEPGTMGGRFTTVEGILTQIRRDLRAQAFGLEDGDAPVKPEAVGDSMTSESQRTWEEFFDSLTQAIEGKKSSHWSCKILSPVAISRV